MTEYKIRKTMLVTKIAKGWYDVFDNTFCHYHVEDADRSHRRHLRRPEYARGKGWRWGIWEQEDGEWKYLDGNSSMAESLEVINTWAQAQAFLR